MHALWRYRGWLLYVGAFAAVAAWSKWDRRNMPPAEPVSGCMTIERIRKIDADLAAIGSRLGLRVAVQPVYEIDRNGCAWWSTAQELYRG